MAALAEICVGSICLAMFERPLCGVEIESLEVSNGSAVIVRVSYKQTFDPHSAVDTLNAPSPTAVSLRRPTAMSAVV